MTQVTVSIELHGELTQEDADLLKRLIINKDNEGVEEIIGSWKKNYLVKIKD